MWKCSYVKGRTYLLFVRSFPDVLYVHAVLDDGPASMAYVSCLFAAPVNQKMLSFLLWTFPISHWRALGIEVMACVFMLSCVCSSVSVGLFLSLILVVSYLSYLYPCSLPRSTGFPRRMPATSNPCTPPPSMEWRTWSASGTWTRQESSGTCWSAIGSTSSMWVSSHLHLLFCASPSTLLSSGLCWTGP